RSSCSPAPTPTPPASSACADEMKTAAPGHPASREEAERAVANAPLSAAPYFALALLELELDEHEAAERALKKVLYLAPNLSEAHYRLGLLRLRRGDVT